MSGSSRTRRSQRAPEIAIIERSTRVIQEPNPMSDVRKEKDSLGFVEVPAKAYYGAQTARAMDNFPISGMRAHSPLIRALGMVNRANEILGGKLGEYAHLHPNDHVNYGQSTNDVFPTAMRLATLLALDELYPVLDHLAATFAEKAQAFHHIMKSGRTHMQDAVPMRLGQEFAAYGIAYMKGQQFLKLASTPLRELGLGRSAVGT